MKSSQVDDNIAGQCDHCGRNFVRESSFIKHVCEQKRRWLDREKVGNRIGYGTWKAYYNRHHPGKKSTEYTDFVKSTYYVSFVKFGNYCADINAVNPGAYGVWLVKNKIPIDSWPSDRQYTRYLVDYLRSEDHLDAVKRTIDTLLDLCLVEGIRVEDSFRYLNSNKLCQLITTGRLSPWVLYQCSSGVEWLSKLNSEQTALIFEYINPERWNIKFRREGDRVVEVKTVLTGIKL
jgi:hypothetical protein